MEVVFISDTHGRHRDLEIPPGDTLVHCGDFSMLGQVSELIVFLNWFAQQPHKNKILVAGNHDLIFQYNPTSARGWVDFVTNEFGKIHYLQDSGVELEGKTFWGIPWVPKFQNWAFMLLDDSTEMEERCSKIPEGIDVVVSHGPPKGVLDLSPYGNEHAGSDCLSRHILRARPKVNAFGHIHAGYGQIQQGGTRFINAAVCTEQYRPDNKPIVIKL